MVILDDMMLAMGLRKWLLNYIQEIVTQKCHHENIKYIFVVQDLMYSSDKFRMLFSNANYIVLFPNTRDSRNIKHIMQLWGFNSKETEEVLQLAFGEQYRSHPYLLLDNTRITFENARIRQGIFPGENLYVYNKII